MTEYDPVGISDKEFAQMMADGSALGSAALFCDANPGVLAIGAAQFGSGPPGGSAHEPHEPVTKALVRRDPLDIAPMPDIAPQELG